MLTASLGPLPAITSPQALGYQVPLDGGASNTPSQTFTVTSDNPTVKATIAKGRFLTINVQHTAAGANDITFAGPMTFQLFEDLTPLSAAKIEQLVTSGFYNGRNFHRISAGFPDGTHYIAQGGSVDLQGHDSPNPAGLVPLPSTGFPFNDEYNLQLVYDGAGQLALANAGNDTNTSQFYITTGAPRSLDFNKTIFGQLVSGGTILTDLTRVATSATDGTTPINQVLITSATLSDTNPNGVVHVDTAGATQGATANLVVTATDPLTRTTTTQPLRVTVGPTAAPANVDPFQNERAFLGAIPSSVTVGRGQTAVFKVNAIDAEPADTLSYVVRGGITAGSSPTFTPLQNATATVDNNGVVTLTPTPGFSGTINVLVGVRDQVDRTGAGLANAGNYDTHVIPVTVNSSATPVNLPPIALPVSVTATTGAPTPIQLAGNTANPGSAQTLTYTVLTQPAHGTLSNLNNTTGTVTYQATGSYVGPDSFTYSVTDVGAPTPNLTSPPATVSITDALGATGAVRQVNRVLLISPRPRFDKGRNAIGVAQVNGTIRVTVNGILDATQPNVSTLDRIVAYGSNLGDTIEINPNVTIPTNLDGGHGGLNFVRAGGAPSRIHAWFGQNLVQGGTGANAIVGQLGHVRVLKSAGTDSVFLSQIDPYHRVAHSRGHKPIPGIHQTSRPGNFYQFVGNRLVKTRQRVTVPLVQS